MPLTRRALLTSVPLTALAVGLGARRTADATSVTTASSTDASGASAATASTGTTGTTGTTATTATHSATAATGGTPSQGRVVSQVPVRQAWLSGVVGTTSSSFARWRGSPVAIRGLYADESVAAQIEQWQFVHSTWTGDVDLAVGGPIDRTWAQVAKGSERSRWVQMARLLDRNWHCRTLYLRYAHEANGDWMRWSVDPREVADFRAAFRLFATTMRRELNGRRLKIVFGPNYGSWRYPVETMWPGNDVVDVVGLSLYEWDDYDTEARWQTFAASTLGPDYWLTFAARHGKPLALSEWGARSPFFLTKMNSWMAAHGGTGAGRLLYDVYMNKEQFKLTGSLATRYRSLDWGS